MMDWVSCTGLRILVGEEEEEDLTQEESSQDTNKYMPGQCLCVTLWGRSRELGVIGPLISGTLVVDCVGFVVSVCSSSPLLLTGLASFPSSEP
jgi:hypothetical protein